MENEMLQETNIDKLVSFFAKYDDVKVHNVFETVVIYCESVIDKEYLNEKIMPFILKIREKEVYGQLLELIQGELLSPTTTLHVLSEKVLDGYVVCYITTSYIIAINVANKPKRAVDESKSEIAIRGPREGFVEDLETNVSLLRKRLKSTHLCYKKFVVGTKSKTEIALLYMEDIMNKQILKEVTKRIEKIDFDGVYSATQFECLVEDDPASIVPMIADSTRPDFVAQSLLKGRFVILVEGNPTAIIGPTNLTFLLKSPEDLHFPYYIVSFSRLFRLIGLIIAVFLPGFWTALISYHQDQIPFPLLATVTMARLGLPFPAPMEIIIVFTLLELFREAGARLPSTIGQTLTVVGGLIIGDAAIRAGFISPSVVVIVALSTLASYTISNQVLAGSITLLRMGCLILSASLGLFGFFSSFFIIVIYLARLRSFGVPYLLLLSSYGLTWRETVQTLLHPMTHFSNNRPLFLKKVQHQRGDRE
ncbi:spore germination protein [Anoxybacillus sp. LAT_38]|uniref:spore germination protein n=1 Tax=Anoxybacillus sp. LAT_26 TaxID=2862719 RepID=UPI001EEABE07|nr:spore germination protein [Anoxybacillus sp. LAT_26]MCG6182307.1 spore germination protein [Anoxybacillus sp. LAT_26]MCG6196148.1 spore germination protein [Anoxybacillus sp. LAT_38]